MEVFYFKIFLSVALVVFSIGISMILLRKIGIWLIIGQILAFKAAIFSCCVFMSSYPDKVEAYSMLIFCGIFLMILFSLVGFALLIRSRRFDKDLKVDAIA